MENDNTYTRKSMLCLNEVYFYTATILNWKHLLKPDKYKQIIIDSLKYLSQKNKIIVYAFVIMPNHIHLVWELIEKNGKEKPNASFTKFTAHKFQKDLIANHPQVLDCFVVNLANREYNFWQRDSLAVLIESRAICEQKIDYIHLNPLQEHWNLAQNPEDYFWSSAKFYESGQDDFGFLTHYMEKF